jgi:hypothetical protein
MTIPAFPAENTDPWYAGLKAVDTAVRADLEGRLSDASLSTTFGGAAASVSEMLELQPMWVTGHSWVASTAATTAGGRWYERVMKRLFMGAGTMKGQSGRTIGDIAMATLGGANAWVPRTKAFVGLVCTINDVTLFDGSVAARVGYAHAWRALLAMVTANGARAADTASFVYSSAVNWAKLPVTPSTAQAAGVASTGSAWWYTATVGDYFEFSFSGTAVDVVLIARAAGAGLVTFTEGGTARGTLDLTAATAQDTPAVHRITGLAAGTHTIRGTLTSGASLTVDSYRIPSTAPAPIVVLGEPPVIPTGSDIPGYVAEVEYLKTQLATICAAFPSVVYVDLTRDGWDQPTMLVEDGKHPNDHGAAWIATQVISAVSVVPYSGGLGTTLIQAYPPPYAPPAGPAIPPGGASGNNAPPPALKPGWASRYKANALAGTAGDIIASWADAGPAGVAFTGANGPTLRSAPFPYVEFDGVNDTLSRAGVPATPGTILIVGRIRVLASGGSQIFSAGNGSVNQNVGKSSAGNWIANSGGVLDSGVVADTAWVVVSAVFDGATSLIGINGEPPLAGSAGTNTSATVTYLGRAGNTATFYQVDIAEVIMYGTALSSADLWASALQLMADYGL